MKDHTIGEWNAQYDKCRKYECRQRQLDQGIDQGSGQGIDHLTSYSPQEIKNFYVYELNCSIREKNIKNILSILNELKNVDKEFRQKQPTIQIQLQEDIFGEFMDYIERRNRMKIPNLVSLFGVCTMAIGAFLFGFTAAGV
jgi:hypothetical protein